MALDEFGRIAKYFAPLAASEVGALGLKDDAALVSAAAGCDLAVSMDCLVAGVHFFADDSPDLIARKALRVNLSDLAAMGARPRGYTLAMALPSTLPADAFLESFTTGLKLDQDQYALGLFGGDSVSTPGPLTLTVTIFGEIVKGCETRRSGAQVGDDIYVSGTIGDAALGLGVARGELSSAGDGSAKFLRDRYHLPRPRVDLGIALVGVASACMDVSDGLVQDLGHLLRASNVGGDLNLDEVPVSQAAQHCLDAGLVGFERLMEGDDYELLFTAPNSKRSEIEAAADHSKTPVRRIGEITEKSGLSLRGRERGTLSLDGLGYRHA